MPATELGDHLRRRRDRVRPEAVGLPAGVGARRVTGLRREEVAMLAGVSVDYYVRLEQGRETSPSPAVLDALASALGLRDDARLHLFDLAGVRAPAASEVGATAVDPGLLQLMAGWPDNPALIYDRAYDVLAANELGSALFSGWAGSANLLDVVFLDPTARDFYRDWGQVAADAVAGFRAGWGRAPGAPTMRATLDRLLEASPEFRELWDRHDVRAKTSRTKRFRHREVGDLELTMQVLDVRSSPGQELVVYHAEPGSTSAEALRILGSLAATRREA